MVAEQAVGETSRAHRLKRETSSIHEQLDGAIMAHKPFADVAGYRRFLAMQHRFHAVVNELYDRPHISAMFVDVKDRRRLSHLDADMRDLQMDAPVGGASPPIIGAQAYGWLYVAEGSNLGAAFLLKEAEKLGLSDANGARHLAGAPEGRGLHWRGFTQALDALDLSADEDAAVVEGAKSAFAFVIAAMDDAFQPRVQTA